ncbi:uncharacterized protein DFL_003499 [Arthrobotrys flagrans]|uniref:Transcription factor IIIC putative zinc-finger domain-containing protein n=1 Tax=Arthrobotrys flagrans TaxID=97331 RepID=A0A437A211_ARTFL|nr:hypothetical protein DFL_003499 [Arthrobotrys flagrans]
MLLKNIDLNFYPSIPQNYKASHDGQLCIPAGPVTYILTNSVLNPGLVSNPPVPSKFKPGDENKIDYRSSENRADWKGYGNDNDGGDGSEFEDSEEDGEEEGEEEREGDVEEDKARPEFQFHWQKLEILQDEEVGDVMKGGVSFQLDQTFKEGFARQMEWSPLGAGTHRRCSLSILTSSRQVLIYQPTTVIGRGLKLQMKLLDRLIDQDVPGDEVVEITWDKLPREICWSQPCTFQTLRWGIPIFTMVDENNELTFVKVIDQDVELLLKTMPNLPEGSRIVNMRWSPWIRMSPEEGIAFFSFITGNGIYVLKMILSRVDGKPVLSCDGEPTLLSPGILPGYEPHALLWYERVYNLPNQAAEALLAAIQHDGVELFGVTLDADKSLNLQRHSKVDMDLPACLAGYTFSDPVWMNYLDLNVCSTNGALSIFRIDLSDLTKSILLKAMVPNFQGRTIIQNDPEFPHPNPFKRDFIDILNEKRDSFIEEWKIMQASCQVYGMAYCALGGIVSVCYRLKPEGVLEYPIKERERCTLSWQLCRDWSEMFDPFQAVRSAKPFTLHGVSGEAFVSDIRFLVDPDDAEDSFNRMEEVVASGMIESGRIPLIPAEKTEIYRLHDVKSSDLADKISLCLFNSTDAVLSRARNLVGLLKANRVAPKKPGVLSAQTGITKLILSTILEIPVLKQSHLRTRKSRLIKWLTACLGIIAFYRDERIFNLSIRTLEELDYRFDLDIEIEKAIIAERKEVLANPGNLDLLVKMTKKIVRIGADEKCNVCTGCVPLDDLMNGRCSNGHLFKRCALTFLLITDSNSRVCGVCSREYCSKKMVEDDEKISAPVDARGERMMVLDNVREPTLFRILFEAVDTCVFCGGSFYDKEEFRKGGEQ